MIDFLGISDWAAKGPTSRILTTVLFADIVDSTGIIDRIGDAAWHRVQTESRA